MSVDIGRFLGDGVGIKKEDTTKDKTIVSTGKAGGAGTIYTLDMTNYDEVVCFGSASSTGSGYFGITVDGSLWIAGKDTVSQAGKLRIKNNNDGTCTVYNWDNSVFKEVSSLSVNFYKENYAGIGLHIIEN
jgi:hypothetical protein